MSEIETPAAPAAGAQSPVQTPPVNAPVVAAPPPAEDPHIVRLTPAQMKERLDETRASTESKIAKELGVTVAEAKVILAAHKAKEDASKSDVERLTAEREALKAQTAELAEYRAAVEVRASAELQGLTEAQRAAVIALAGDHPAKQLKTIETLRPSWQAVAQAQEAASKASAEAARIKTEADAKAAADAAAIAAKGAPARPIREREEPVPQGRHLPEKPGGHRGRQEASRLCLKGIPWRERKEPDQCPTSLVPRFRRSTSTSLRLSCSCSPSPSTPTPS